MCFLSDVALFYCGFLHSDMVGHGKSHDFKSRQWRSKTVQASLTIETPSAKLLWNKDLLFPTKDSYKTLLIINKVLLFPFKEGFL